MHIFGILLIFVLGNVTATSEPVNDFYVHFDNANKTMEKEFNDGKCRALAMRGGGTKGAYEVGALKMMTEMLP